MLCILSQTLNAQGPRCPRAGVRQTIALARSLSPMVLAAALAACGPSPASMDAAVDADARPSDSSPESAADSAPDSAPDALPPTCEAGSHAVGGGCVANGGVRPLTPHSLANTTLLRPTLRFALPAGADGAVVELCRDRACAMVIETLRVRGATARPATALPARSTVFWRARASVGSVEDQATNHGATWLFHTPVRDAPGGVDTSFDAHVDFNGDGFDDAALRESSGPTATRVRVLLGSATGLSGTPSRLLASPGREPWSTALAGSCDVNGDGYGDLLIGVPNAASGAMDNAGAIAVFLGSDTALAATPSGVLFGSNAQDSLGRALSCAGDVNGDGYGDVISGSSGVAVAGVSDAGRAWLFFGSATGVSATAAWSIDGSSQTLGLGASVTGGGDFNGDGFSDIVIAAPATSTATAMFIGGAQVFHGSSAGVAAAPSTVVLGRAAMDGFGTHVALAGDVNGDGYSDLIASAQTGAVAAIGRAGYVALALGGASGVAATPSVVFDGPAAGSYLGERIASAGDTNGDGFADIVLAAPRASSAMLSMNGAALLFRGAATGPSTTASQRWEGTAQTGLHFPTALGANADFNGDGFADLWVGARNAAGMGVANAGAAYVYPGSAMGAAANPTIVAEGSFAYSEIGGAFAR